MATVTCQAAFPPSTQPELPPHSYILQANTDSMAGVLGRGLLRKQQHGAEVPGVGAYLQGKGQGHEGCGMAGGPESTGLPSWKPV